jgi:hypothetical protein
MCNFLYIKTVLQIRLLLIDNLKKAWKNDDICYPLYSSVQAQQDHALWMKQNFMPVNLFANMHSEVTISSAQLDPQ